jgi:hypothetical protein
MVALTMIMIDKRCDRVSKVALADENDPIEALFFDRSHEPLRVRIRVGRLERRLDDEEASVVFHDSADVFQACP